MDETCEHPKWFAPILWVLILQALGFFWFAVLWWLGVVR